MLLAATNFKGDATVLEAQRVAANAAFPAPANLHVDIVKRAKRIFALCQEVVAGSMPKAGKQSALHFISNLTDHPVSDFDEVAR